MGSYEELFKLDTIEAIRRMDKQSAPLHAGDAFLAVMVLRGVSELRESAERLDRASRRFDIAALVLAVVAVGVAIAELAS